MASKRPHFQVVNGVVIPPFFSKECFESVFQFKPKGGDIFVATYPKCGTTWMQNVVINILRRARPLDEPRDFFLASPFLDQLGAKDSEKLMIRPGAYKTHLPFGKVPWSDETKYIVVARNPKDCCVSFYHHMRQLPGYQFSEATFGEFFDLFVSGDLEYGDYFDHLLSWYDERHRPNVLFTTYEEMKTSLKDVVLRVAEFVASGEAQYLEDNPQVLASILDSCSLEKMKFLNDVLNGMYHNIEAVLADPKVPVGRKHIAAHSCSLPAFKRERIDFIRNGAVGDWRSMLTPEQNKRMDRRIRVISKSSDVMTVWKDVL